MGNWGKIYSINKNREIVLTSFCPILPKITEPNSPHLFPNVWPPKHNLFFYFHWNFYFETIHNFVSFWINKIVHAFKLSYKNFIIKCRGREYSL